MTEVNVMIQLSHFKKKKVPQMFKNMYLLTLKVNQYKPIYVVLDSFCLQTVPWQVSYLNVLYL